MKPPRRQSFAALLVSVFVLVLAGVLTNAGQAAPSSYTVTELLPVTPFMCSDPRVGIVPAATVANAINDAGMITGSSEISTCDSSTITMGWNGAPVARPLMNGYFSVGTAINNHGVVAGWSTLRGFAGSAPFVLDSGGARDLGFLGPLIPDAPYGEAFGINDGGDIVGSVYFQIDHPPFAKRAFLFSTSNGTVRDLGNLGGPATFSYAYGINNSGVVVGKSGTLDRGDRAFRWTASHGMEDLGPGSANAINQHGWIVGSNGQAFLLRPGSARSYLGHTTVSANAINSQGVIVGNPAFRYDGVSVVDLNSFVVGTGWTLLTATGINSSGQIVGQGNLNGVRRGYMLTPK